MSPRKSVSVGLSLVCFSVVTGAVGLSAGAQTLTTLASLGGDAGAWAHGGVVADADGTLYGTAYGSGEGVGTIFELAASTHSLSQLGVFNGGNGANPEASLLLAPNGDLYGTSWGGGRYGQGTLFKLPAGSSTPVALYVAGDPTIGINPTSGLIADGNGNLYGTMTGGSDHLGSVFQFDPSTNTMTALATFSPGVNPDVHGHLWDDSAGNLYGTTASNGNSGGAGGIFKVDAATHTLTMLYSFNTYDGAFAQSGVIGDGKGNLYGTTTSGG
ncbi:MAG TPA: choice-of-anchor tandem repeat GloVer-containing protein, partial [Tepidisphaeraceae bacterium]|nr:choice-of-anchor tandem repeat GloVer-containing protein [Tepidisphaeraceae bacterium]